MEDTRPECKYGPLCYQKNEHHHKKYRHPPRRKIEEKPCGGTSPKRQKFPGDVSTVDMKKFLGVESAENLQKLSGAESPGNMQKFSGDESTDNMKQLSDESTGSMRKLLGDETEENTCKMVSTSIKETLKKMFLVDMPNDFYSFWDFCSFLCPKKPEDALKDCELSLVGPFDLLSGKLKKSGTSKASEYLTHWRYYYDPPEFQTVLRGDDKKKFHMGYFRDEPESLPCFVASNSAAVNCVITPVAENLFGAVNSHLESLRRLCDPFRKLKLKKLQDTLQTWAREKSFTVDSSTMKMKARDKKVVAQTFHKAGIVVPYNKKTELGYRPLLVTEGDLKKTLKRIAESKGDAERDRNMEALQHVLTAASIANDECDFGTGLELGLDLFSYGHKVFHPMVLHLLTTAYSLLGREPFAEIVKAHLNNRTNIP